MNAQFLDHCWPHAIGSGARGAAAIEIVSCRELLDLNPDWVVVSDDVKNCHSELPRHQVAAALSNVEHARNMIPGLTADLQPAQPMFLRSPNRTLEPFTQEDGFTPSGMEDSLQAGIPSLWSHLQPSAATPHQSSKCDLGPL